MRRLWIGLVLILALLITGRGTTVARDIRQGDQCVIAVDETIHGDLFALCRTLNIKGHIEGNLFAAATDAEITGAVDGDVYLAAGQLDAAGVFGGNLHFGGPVLRILPTARFSSEKAHLVSLSLSTTLDEGVTLPGGIVAGGYQLVLNGATSSEVTFWGSALNINGNVNQDVNAVVGDPESKGISQLQTLLIPFNWDVNLINPGLTLTKSGSIGGDLHYSGPVAANIEGQITGKTDFNQLVTQPDLTQIISEQESTNLYISEVGQQFAVLALIGLIGLLFLPRQLQMPLRHIYSRPLPSVGVGLLAFIVSFPIVLIILLFIIFVIAILVILRLDSLVVTLFGVALVGTWSGGASMFYFTAIFISRVLLCMVVGRGLVHMVRKDDPTPRMMLVNLLVGVLVLSALMSLPVVGLIISAVAAFLGLGAILISIQAQITAYRDSLVSLPPNMPRYTGRLGGTRSLPPPKLNDEPKPPGMENLPEGFEWWGDE